MLQKNRLGTTIVHIKSITVRIFRYITVGNHDHKSGGEMYQVEFSKLEPQWHFPSLAYGFKTSSQVRLKLQNNYFLYANVLFIKYSIYF